VKEGGNGLNQWQNADPAWEEHSELFSRVQKMREDTGQGNV
jgi:hypothetical protein